MFLAQSRRANHYTATRANSARVPDAAQRAPGDAQHRPVTLHRRAGTHSRASGTMDPGSAAHHAASHSASKTRVNALMALRSIRGTTLRFAQNLLVRLTLRHHR